jgi:prepilin-type N-terminal cleavage/methylation domain-containing protein
VSAVFGISKYLPMRNVFKFQKGFTLPELLIVMTIIGALASVVLVTYPASQKKARDAIRKSDIKQYQTAMEIYYNKNDAYFAATGNLATACSTNGLSDNCPDDPKSGNYKISSTTSDYLLWAQLEYPPSPTTYFYSCSTGKSGETTSNPSSTDPC